MAVLEGSGCRDVVEKGVLLGVDPCHLYVLNRRVQSCYFCSQSRQCLIKRYPSLFCEQEEKKNTKFSILGIKPRILFDIKSLPCEM